MQSVKRCRRKFVSPLLELGLGPIPIQADRIFSEVFGKRQAIFAFTDQDIAKSPAPRRTSYTWRLDIPLLLR